MSDKVNINNVFSLGFRCNSDEFLLNFLKIRKYSSPFSYMVIDINTALNFIANNFENYTNKDFIEPGKNTYTFNKHIWSCNNVHKCSIIESDYQDILDMEKVCIWNHHYLYDENTVKSINRRSFHLLDCLKKFPDRTLLFYIEKIQNYGEKKCYFDKNILDNYACNFLILIPLLNFNSDPLVFCDNSRIKIIYFKSNLESRWSVDTNRHIEEWNKLQILINELYNFDIEDRKVEEEIV